MVDLLPASNQPVPTIGCDNTEIGLLSLSVSVTKGMKSFPPCEPVSRNRATKPSFHEGGDRRVCLSGDR